ncbi:MAG: acetyl-CoA sensor PanZ family protein [Thalassolituus sp.]|uniref:acetyl-CoA sensor PanZ family protein n=1 Tax=Thalassolituus sp. UBA3500 TaxID=1947664 RepID=UPI00263B1E29|nr:acetyl-CoA sensor PanZ family protein [Thalassolituus sp. UBA3500]MDQ4423735.1 acetyl-CoA sensor PanZ family protein [Thalassolituus sp.]
MPVKLEHLTEPTEDDFVDFEKIRNDTAPHGLAVDEPLREWITENRWIVGGRFNDRIIGALLAERTGDHVRLSKAGVRRITQGRGVMHQMLHFLCKWADEESLTLEFNDSEDSLSEAILRRNFERQGDLLVYKRTK